MGGAEMPMHTRKDLFGEGLATETLCSEAGGQEIEIGAGQLGIVAEIEAAIMDQVGSGEIVDPGNILSEKGLPLDVAGDHGPHFHTGFGETLDGGLSELRGAAENRKGKTGQALDVPSVKRQVNGIPTEHISEEMVVLFPEPDSFREILKLPTSEKAGDFGGPKVESEIVEGILGLELVGNVKAGTPFGLLLRGQIAIPAVGTHDAQHLAQVKIVGDGHAAFDGRHVVGHEKRGTGCQTKIAAQSATKAGSQRFAIVFEQQNSALSAKVGQGWKIAGKAQDVGDEESLQIDFIKSLGHMFDHCIHGDRGNIKGNRGQAMLNDRHDICGPSQGGEPDAIAGLETAEIFQRHQNGEIGAAAAVKENRIPALVPIRELTLELETFPIHAQSRSGSDEFHQSLAGLFLVCKGALHERDHFTDPPFALI